MLQVLCHTVIEIVVLSSLAAASNSVSSDFMLRQPRFPFCFAVVFVAVAVAVAAHVYGSE